MLFILNYFEILLCTSVSVHKNTSSLHHSFFSVQTHSLSALLESVMHLFLLLLVLSMFRPLFSAKLLVTFQSICINEKTHTSPGGHQRTIAAFDSPVAVNIECITQLCLLHTCECDRVSRTNWKQLRTEGSMLEPPKEATSPSCRGIWMESWRRRPRRRWSQKPVALATCLNKTGGRRAGQTK